VRLGDNLCLAYPDLDLAELLSEIEDEFGIKIPHEAMRTMDGTFDGLVRYVASHRGSMSRCGMLIPPFGQKIGKRLSRRTHGGEPMAVDYTTRQGQFLTFIYYYTKLNGIPPAELDMQRYFRVSPPTVHEMVKTLHSRGLISREPGKPRSIRVLLSREELPDLE
jgi:hypothetical protein